MEVSERVEKRGRHWAFVAERATRIQGASMNRMTAESALRCCPYSRRRPQQADGSRTLPWQWPRPGETPDRDRLTRFDQGMMQ